MHFCAVFACNSCFKQSEKRHCVAIHCKLTNGLTETASVQTLKENTAKCRSSQKTHTVVCFCVKIRFCIKKQPLFEAVFL